MKYYSMYILQGKIQKDLEKTLQAMFSKGSVDAEGLSNYFADIDKTLIECIENYGSNIMQLFDFESLLEFIKNIDILAKEKVGLILKVNLNCRLLK